MSNTTPSTLGESVATILISGGLALAFLWAISTVLGLEWFEQVPNWVLGGASAIWAVAGGALAYASRSEANPRHTYFFYVCLHAGLGVIFAGIILAGATLAALIPAKRLPRSIVAELSKVCVHASELGRLAPLVVRLDSLRHIVSNDGKAGYEDRNQALVKLAFQAGDSQHRHIDSLNVLSGRIVTADSACLAALRGRAQGDTTVSRNGGP